MHYEEVQGKGRGEGASSCGAAYVRRKHGTKPSPLLSSRKGGTLGWFMGHTMTQDTHTFLLEEVGVADALGGGLVGVEV